MRLTCFFALAAMLCQSDVAVASCLNEVASFAGRICGEIEKSGTRRVVDASGRLEANVGSIVRRVVGGGSAEASGDVLVESYSNVLQNQLGAELFNVRACRERMVSVALTQVCRPARPSDGPLPPGDRPPLKASCNYAAPGFTLECATNFAGFVVDSKDPPFYGAVSVEECASFCRVRGDCVAFNYNLRARNNCFLYKGVGQKRYDDSIVSGFK